MDVWYLPTPWKINMVHLQITHEKKGKWSEPNLHEDMFHVNLQGCTWKPQKSTIHVGKYTSPLDGMGVEKASERSEIREMSCLRVCVFFWWPRSVY